VGDSKDDLLEPQMINLTARLPLLCDVTNATAEIVPAVEGQQQKVLLELQNALYSHKHTQQEGCHVHHLRVTR